MSPTVTIPIADITNLQANDNAAFNSVAINCSAVAEIDLGPDTARVVSAMIASYSIDDLSGPRLLFAAREISRALQMNAPGAARDAMQACAHGELDVVIAKNLFAAPADLEPTPKEGEPSPAARVYALANAGLTVACGQLPVAVSNENNGVYDRHVRVRAANVAEASSFGGGEIGPHTEHAFRYDGAHGRFSPQVDGICLTGLRNDDAEATGFAVLRDVLSRLNPGSIKMLQLPIFGMVPPDSSEATEAAAKMSVLYWRHGELSCAYRADKIIVPDSADAKNAVADLNAAIARVARSVTLLPGVAWFARNPRCLHWRDEIKNHTRWLVRGFGLAPESPAVFADPHRPELIQY